MPGWWRNWRASSDYAERRKAILAFNRDSQIIRKGIALTPVKFGISFTATWYNQAGALVHIYTDGSVHLNHGGTEMGQGLNTKVAQVLADEFQIDLQHVKITATHTGKVPIHVSDGCVVRLGPQRHGGCQCGPADQGAAG